MKQLSLEFRHEYQDIRKAVSLNGRRFLTFSEQPNCILQEEAASAIDFLGSILGTKAVCIVDVIEHLLQLEKEEQDLARFTFICGHFLTSFSNEYK